MLTLITICVVCWEPCSRLSTQCTSCVSALLSHYSFPSTNHGWCFIIKHVLLSTLSIWCGHDSCIPSDSLPRLCLLWGEGRMSTCLCWRERWMAHAIGWMTEHTIGEIITWTPFVWYECEWKAQGVKKQEGTQGECYGCEVAHCGSSAPSRHPPLGASQNNTLIILMLAFSFMESPLKEEKWWLWVKRQPRQWLISEKGFLGRKKSHTLHSIVSLSIFLWFMDWCFPSLC